MNLRRFFGPAPRSIAGVLNAPELARIAVTALAAGGGAGGLLTALAAHVPEFVAPGWAAFASAALALAVETYRRLDHGAPGVLVPAVLPFRPFRVYPPAASEARP